MATWPMINAGPGGNYCHHRATDCNQYKRFVPKFSLGFCAIGVEVVRLDGVEIDCRFVVFLMTTPIPTCLISEGTCERKLYPL